MTFHVIDPGTEDIVRLIPNSWLDHFSIFKDVITTGLTGEEEEEEEGFSQNDPKKRRKEKEGKAKKNDLER